MVKRLLVRQFSSPLAQKVYRRRHMLLPYLLGLALRHHFTSAGFVGVLPGLPFPKIMNAGEIIVDNISLFPGVRVECMPGGKVYIGKGTYINRNTNIIAAENISIGANCKISWDVIITDTDQHPLPSSGEVSTRPVQIDDDVWIGARAIILKGVTIGRGAVVAAGAIVTKDVPPRTIVANRPATVIRYLPDAENSASG